MKVGDLVMKVGGYGGSSGWTGIVIGHRKYTTGFHKNKKELTKLVVMTNDGIENWVSDFCEVISDGR